MTRARGSTRSVSAPVWVTVALTACVALLVLTIQSSAWLSASTLTLVATFVLAILVGEWYQISAPGFRGSAPVSTASAFGFAFTDMLPGAQSASYSAPFVAAVTALAMIAVAMIRHVSGRQPGVAEALGRFAAVVVVALLYRVVYLGEANSGSTFVQGLRPWQTALLLLAIAVVGLAIDILVTTTLRALSGAAAWAQTLADELRSSFALLSALAVTGVLIALAVPALGAPAVPLFLAPLVLTLFSFRRYVSIKQTYLQSIRSLSRLTDIAGYTPAGHSERVAALSLAVGRELGLPERELLDLEYAALLHDIGQVALVDPIPGGATVLAAPADQRRIAADTVAIVRETGVLDAAAEILEHQTTPFRQMREFDEDIPLTSRILKVVNAFEDLTAGVRNQRARTSATERIYLGLGYEYDPRVVDALMAVISGTRNSAY